MSTQHEAYRFSISIHSTDLPVVGCLRALAQFSQRTGNNRIPWGGTKDNDWLSAGHIVTFRFTSASFRAGFIEQAHRVLSVDSWHETAQSDYDPAIPQR